MVEQQVRYPDSDGKPMADNTLQYEWIVLLRENLAKRFADEPNVLVAADLLWYPVEGEPKIAVAPDVFVADRPKGYRGSYMQWKEGGLPPKFVIEVYSPSNSFAEMVGKQRFYERHGVTEFLVVDPFKAELIAWRRENGGMDFMQPPLDEWTSATTGVRFQIVRQDGKAEIQVFHPDGSPFKSFEEVALAAEASRKEAEQARQEETRAQAEADRQRQEKEAALAELERLRKALGK